MRKFRLYHGLVEGGTHIVASGEGIFYPKGEDVPSEIWDVHPPDEELKQKAIEENRFELNKDRPVKHKSKVKK
jgi:hypothetical protein